MRSYCISHAKDVDGIASAALVVAARGAAFKLTDYDGLLDELDAVPEVEELVLCDLGTDPARFPNFADRMRRITKNSRVTYIDHHFMTRAAKLELRGLGLRLVHSAAECAAMLTYRTYRSELPEDAKLLALYGAVTDYLDISPMAGKMMQRFDRHFVLLEATLLSYAVAKRGDEESYLNTLVGELSRMKLPHEISGVARSALQQVDAVKALAESVRRSGIVTGRMVYAETTQHATGNVAKLLLGGFDVPVAVAFREKHRKGWIEVSLRGTLECRTHLGKTISLLAEKYGGDGGGHRLAAGCSIPRKNIQPLLDELGSRV